MYRGMDHVAIAAQDPQGLINWYCAHLEMHVVAHNGQDPPTALLAGVGGSMIEIMPAQEVSRGEAGLFDPGLRHMALRVDDFDAAYAHLQQLGVEFVGEIGSATGGGPIVSFKDPEGNILQIVQRLADCPS